MQVILCRSQGRREDRARPAMIMRWTMHCGSFRDGAPPILNSPADLLADHAAPPGEALGRMLVHPFGELRRAHQARLHRDVGEVGCGDGLLMAVRWRGEVAEHGNDLDHARLPPSLRRAEAPLDRSPTGSAGGKMLS